MPATNFPEYARQISATINSLLSLAPAQVLNLQIDQRSILIGFIAGTLVFSDDSELHFREYVDFTAPHFRLMYAYHYQSADKHLIFRYDNAPHKPALSHPEHKHTSDKIIPFPTPILTDVIDEVLDIVGL